MSVRKLSTASILTPSYKNSKIWDGETFPGYFESIATVSVGSAGAATADFTNIPSTYTHLQIRGIARASTTGNRDNLYIRFNGDDGSNYFWHNIAGTGSDPLGSENSGGLVSYGRLGNSVVPQDDAGANIYGVTVTDILDYGNTNKYKTVRALSGQDQNTTTGRLFFASTLWQEYEAITSISLSSGSNFKQYTTFALYGIRGA